MPTAGAIFLQRRLRRRRRRRRRRCGGGSARRRPSPRLRHCIGPHARRALARRVCCACACHLNRPGGSGAHRGRTARRGRGRSSGGVVRAVERLSTSLSPFLVYLVVFWHAAAGGADGVPASRSGRHSGGTRRAVRAGPGGCLAAGGGRRQACGGRHCAHLRHRQHLGRRLCGELVWGRLV